jgi:site-specific recombinase XerD
VPALIETLRHIPPPMPAITDSVACWLPARVANPLNAAGINTLVGLAQRVRSGGRWWKGIDGLGRRGASVASDFVDKHTSLAKAAAQAVVVAQGGVLPWERFRAPRALDGSQGAFRAPRSTCVLGASNDYEAVQAWLSLHEAPATLRAYRKEIERLMLWCIVERDKPLSSLTTEDAVAYRAFLRRPTPKERWVGPIAPRSRPAWRPFQAALSPSSAAYALQVINVMYRWLVEQRYVLANPFSGIKVRGGERTRPIDTRRAFTAQEWTLVRKAATLSEIADRMPPDSHARLLFLLDFSYATGLRASELVGARLGHIRVDDAGQYWLDVRGKGEKTGDVVLPPLASAALERYLQHRDLSVRPEAWNPTTPVLASVKNEPVTASRLWRVMKTFFRRAADALEPVNPATAARARRASPHWMRHTHASHALAQGVDVALVRDNLRHSNIAVTSTYLHADATRRAQSISGAFKR